MKLFDSPRIKALVDTIETDEGLDRALILLLKRQNQFLERKARHGEIRSRCAEIAERLPDANAKEARQLADERAALMAEDQALPADLAVSARLYAEALAAWSGAITATVTTEHRAINAKLATLEDPYRQAKADQANWGDQIESPQYQDAYARYVDLYGQRKPLLDRSADLQELLELIKRHINTVLYSPVASSRPGGIKFSEGRPQDTYIRGFVDQWERQAA